VTVRVVGCYGMRAVYCDRLRYLRGYNKADPIGALSDPTKLICFEPTVWPDTCCSLHRIRVLWQWAKCI
jgi:hypothetical protein